MMIMQNPCRASHPRRHMDVCLWVYVPVAHWTANVPCVFSSPDDLQGCLPWVSSVCEPSFRLRSEFSLLWETNWPSEEGCHLPWRPAGQPSACGFRQTSPSAQSPQDWEFGKVELFTGNCDGRRSALITLSPSEGLIGPLALFEKNYNSLSSYFFFKLLRIESRQHVIRNKKWSSKTFFWCLWRAKTTSVYGSSVMEPRSKFKSFGRLVLIHIALIIIVRD